MKKLILSIALLSLVACASSNPQKIADKRAEIDAMAAETLKGLFKESSGAKRLYDESYAYAVFSNVKISIIITGGGGSGVAVGSGWVVGAPVGSGTGSAFGVFGTGVDVGGGA